MSATTKQFSEESMVRGRGFDLPSEGDYGVCYFRAPLECYLAVIFPLTPRRVSAYYPSAEKCVLANR
jgi:hypothetical protein